MKDYKARLDELGSVALNDDNLFEAWSIARELLAERNTALERAYKAENGQDDVRAEYNERMRACEIESEKAIDLVIETYTKKLSAVTMEKANAQFLLSRTNEALVDCMAKRDKLEEELKERESTCDKCGCTTYPDDICPTCLWDAGGWG